MATLLLRLLPAVSLLFCFWEKGMAQSSIQGSLKSNDGLPVVNASVFLLEPQTDTLLQAGFSDSLGRYELQTERPGNFKITVTAEGYQTETRLLNGTSEIGQTQDFILTNISSDLENVIVSSRKPLFEKKSDRLIFHVANSSSTAGGTALEAIGKAPGVLLNRQNNTLNLAGKGNVNILINGKLLQLSGADLFAYLEAISAENVLQVELITTPPAQYEASGNSGLINLVLKKNGKPGFSGQANAAYLQAFYGRMTAGGAVNFHKNKLTAFANVNLSRGANFQTERLNTSFAEQEYRMTDPYKKSVQNGQITTGLDYQLHPSGNLSLSYTGTAYGREDQVGNYTAVIQKSTGAVDSTLFTKGNALQDQTTHLLNLTYDWNLDTSGKKISVSANRLWYDSDRDRRTESENYSGYFQLPTGFSVANHATGQNQIAITTAQADATLPYPFATLAVGGKISAIAQNSENRFYTKIGANYVEDPNVSNAFNYTENVGALYVSAQKDIGKFSLQAGLRMEATVTKGHSQQLAQSNKNSYTNLFPTLTASYQPKENKVWTLSYSKRILRPAYKDLDPFRVYFSPTSYAEGNPFLQPAYSHETALSYTLNGRFTFQGYYQLEQDHFGPLFTVDSTTQSTAIRQENYSDMQSAGLGIITAFQPYSFWEVQTQAFVTRNEIKTKKNFGALRTQTLPSFYFSVGNALSLNKKGTLITEVSAYLMSRYHWELSELQPTGSVDTSFKALLLDKKLVLSLAATDLFRTAGSKSRNLITGQTMQSYFDQQSLRLSVSFKMGGKNSRERTSKETGIEAEQRRM